MRPCRCVELFEYYVTLVLVSSGLLAAANSARVQTCHLEKAVVQQDMGQLNLVDEALQVQHLKYDIMFVLSNVAESGRTPYLDLLEGAV
jgi:hypothetical protein